MNIIVSLLLEVGFSFLTFCVFFAAALAGMAMQRRLPEAHLAEPTQKAVQLIMGLIATMAALVLSLLVASAHSYLETQQEDVQNLARDVLLLVVFGLGIDALIHFLNRLRLEEPLADTPEHAIRRARVLVGPAIILTTIVLAFGLGVTVFSDLPSLRTFGLVCGFTLLASLIADLVFLPATIMVGRRLWPHKVRDQT